MDPITSAIVAALAAIGKDAASSAAKDAYAALKSITVCRLGSSDIAVRLIDDLEAHPNSQGRAMVLSELIQDTNAAADDGIKEAVRKLEQELAKIGSAPQRITTTMRGGAIGVAGAQNVSIAELHVYGSSDPKKSPPENTLDRGGIELHRIANIFGYKDEMDIRNTFDINNMLFRNIEILKIKIHYIRTGAWQQFNYDPYREGNGDMIFRARDGKYIVGDSGVTLVNQEPHDVSFLVCTTLYQSSMKELSFMINSPSLPYSVKEALAEVSSIIGKNIELLVDVLNEKLHANEEFILQYNNYGTPFYGVIQSTFAARFLHLKPAVDTLVRLISTR